MKVALVHDWLTGMRGGEKVLERLCGLYPDAPITTLVWNRGAVSQAIESHPIRTSFLQSMPAAASAYRWYLPLFPRAIESFDRGLVTILGGHFKGGDLKRLREPLRRRAKAVLSIGEARPLIREALEGAVDVKEAGSLDEAVATAFELAKPSGVVLLAPACASFDMFRDYAERGRRFKEAVSRIGVR